MSKISSVKQFRIVTNQVVFVNTVHRAILNTEVTNLTFSILGSKISLLCIKCEVIRSSRFKLQTVLCWILARPFRTHLYRGLSESTDKSELKTLETASNHDSQVFVQDRTLNFISELIWLSWLQVQQWALKFRHAKSSIIMF